jgi:NADPH2:quinone reductase
MIQAGAGGVGHLAVQLAREAGARVAATVNTEEKAELVRSLSAEKAVFYERTDFVKECLDWTGGTGVDCAVDLVGGKSFFRALSAIRFYGRIVTLLGPDQKSADWTEARMRNLTVSFYLMFVPMYYGLDAHIERQAGILAT